MSIETLRAKLHAANERAAANQRPRTAADLAMEGARQLPAFDHHEDGPRVNIEVMYGFALANWMKHTPIEGIHEPVAFFNSHFTRWYDRKWNLIVYATKPVPESIRNAIYGAWFLFEDGSEPQYLLPSEHGRYRS